MDAAPERFAQTTGMEEGLAPATQLLGAALPRDLAWERAGRRLVWQAVAGAVLAMLAVVGWQWMTAERLTPAPRVVRTVAKQAVQTSVAIATTVRKTEVIALTAAQHQILSRLEHPTEWKHTEHGTGEASYYASGFEGRSTASGEPYRAAKLTAAHRTLPFGTLLKVTNVRNGRSVVVRVNDRGPFHARRVVDLSRAAAAELGLVRRGRGQVRLDVLSR